MGNHKIQLIILAIDAFKELIMENAKAMDLVAPPPLRHLCACVMFVSCHVNSVGSVEVDNSCSF